MGVGFGAVLVVLGAIRSCWARAGCSPTCWLLFGESARNWHFVISEDYPALLLAILPPGAFIVTGFLIAAKNAADNAAKRRAGQPGRPFAGAKRVRVTGKIS